MDKQAIISSLAVLAGTVAKVVDPKDAAMIELGQQALSTVDTAIANLSETDQTALQAARDELQQKVSQHTDQVIEDLGGSVE